MASKRRWDSRFLRWVSSMCIAIVRVCGLEGRGVIGKAVLGRRWPFDLQKVRSLGLRVSKHSCSSVLVEFVLVLELAASFIVFGQLEDALIEWW